MCVGFICSRCVKNFKCFIDRSPQPAYRIVCVSMVSVCMHMWVFENTVCIIKVFICRKWAEETILYVLSSWNKIAVIWINITCIMSLSNAIKTVPLFKNYPRMKFCSESCTVNWSSHTYINTVLMTSLIEVCSSIYTSITNTLTVCMLVIKSE